MNVAPYIPFKDITQNSHCLCPEHVGSGGGSSWVTVSQFGPAVHCCQCNGGTTWFPEAVSLPPGFVVPSHVEATEEDIQALLADLDNLPVKKVVPSKTALTPKRAEHLRAADAGRAVAGAKKWEPIVQEHLETTVGMVPAPCGFKQVLRGRRQARLHHRDCGKGTCLRCMTKRIALKFAAIEFMPLWDEEKRGTPMGHRDLWIWETTESRRKSLVEALKRSEPNSSTGISSVEEKGSLSGGASSTPTTPALDPADHGAGFDPVNGYVMFRHGDDKTITVIATTPLPNSRVWHGRAKKIPSGTLSDVLEGLLAKCFVPAEPLPKIRFMEIIGFDAEVPPRSITSSRTLTLDPQTLWKRASKSEYTVAHQKGAKPEVVAQRWKEAGVLRQAQAMHQAADGGFMPGFASTVQIDDPALLDQVLALASADHEEPVPVVVETVEIIGDLEDVETGVEVHNLPEDALVAVDPKDKTQVVVFTAKQVKEAHEALGVTSPEFVPKDMRTWLCDSTAQHLLKNEEPVLKAPLSAVPVNYPGIVYGPLVTDEAA